MRKFHKWTCWRYISYFVRFFLSSWSRSANLLEWNSDVNTNKIHRKSLNYELDFRNQSILLWRQLLNASLRGTKLSDETLSFPFNLNILECAQCIIQYFMHSYFKGTINCCSLSYTKFCKKHNINNKFLNLHNILIFILNFILLRFL